MRKILLLLIIMWFAPDVFGQVQYEYDAAGNRTSRTIILTSPRNSSSEDDDPQTRSLMPDDYEMPKYEDRLGERNVVIYPNPTRGLLQIEFQGYGEMQDARLLLYNLQGSLLRQVNNVELSVSLDLSPYPPGMYILILIEGTSRSEWRIIKQ